MWEDIWNRSCPLYSAMDKETFQFVREKLERLCFGLGVSSYLSIVNLILVQYLIAELLIYMSQR